MKVLGQKKFAPTEKVWEV